MRLVAFLLAVATLSGCFSPDEGGGNGSSVPPGDRTAHDDRLSEHLVEGSGAYYVEPWIMDRVVFGPEANVTLLLGRGVHCEGNLSSLAPGLTGTVTCALRIQHKESAVSTDVRELDIGQDTQRLTLLSPTQPMEWRINATVDGRPELSQDSGWRLVDFTPIVTLPVVTLDLADPCDIPDAQEAYERDILRNTRGRAFINVSFSAQRTLAKLEWTLAGSVYTAGATADPAAHGGPTATGFAAVLPLTQALTPMWVRIPVDVEVAEEPSTPPPTEGPCPGAVAVEDQVWELLVTHAGADGVPRSVAGHSETVDVYLVP